MDHTRFLKVFLKLLVPPRPRRAERGDEEDTTQTPHQIRTASTPKNPLVRCTPALNPDTMDINTVLSETGDKTQVAEKSNPRSSTAEAPATPSTKVAAQDNSSDASRVRLPRVRPGAFETRRRKCLRDMIACPLPEKTKKNVDLESVKWTESEKAKVYYSAASFAPEYLDLYVGMAKLSDQDGFEVGVVCS